MKNQTQLHFMCGKPGAGKSTLSRSLAVQHQAILLCEDMWLTYLFPGELVTFDDYIECTLRIKTVLAPVLVEILAKQSVVLDFQANTIGTRHWFRSIFEEANCGHTLHYVQASDSLCLQRIAKRNAERPSGSYEMDEEMYDEISSLFREPDPREGFNVSVHLQSE